MSRPAEKAGAGGGGIAVLLIALGVPQGVAIAAVAVAAVIPGVVTWTVTHGGVRGALRALWGGSRGQS